MTPFTASTQRISMFGFPVIGARSKLGNVGVPSALRKSPESAMRNGSIWRPLSHLRRLFRGRTRGPAGLAFRSGADAIDAGLERRLEHPDVAGIADEVE